MSTAVFRPSDPRRTGLFEDARLAARPPYAMLVQFPVVCFVGALLTDLAYCQTDLYLWETFSAWLLAFGCVMAGLAGLVGLAYLVVDRRVRHAAGAGPHAALSVVAAILAVVNAFVHSRDGYTAVVPTGLALSAIVVVLMIGAAWFGRPRVDVDRVPMGVAA